MIIEPKDYLNTVYANREKTSYPQTLAEELVHRFNIAPGQFLLDLGCGKGDMLRAFQKSGLTVAGLDNAPSAMSQDKSFEIKKCDISCDSYPYADNTFDVVFTKSVIEHIVAPDTMLREIRRVLKPGGLLIVLTPDFAKLHTVFYEDPTHVHPYVPQGLKTLLIMHGFKDPKATLFCHHQKVWQNAFLAQISKCLQLILPIKAARWLTGKTSIKFFRWAVERQILGAARN